MTTTTASTRGRRLLFAVVILIIVFVLYLPLVVEYSHLGVRRRPTTTSGVRPHEADTVVLVAALRSATCQSAFTFARQFYQDRRSASRSAEIRTALLATMRDNPCSRFVLVTSDPDDVDDVVALQRQSGVDVDLYWAPVEVTYHRLLVAVRLASTTGLLVLSTADVGIASVAPLADLCGRPLRDPRRGLFVVSARDHDADSCRPSFVRGLFAVVLGNVTAITDAVLAQAVFSPAYRGATNVVAHLLADAGRRPLYNLCPYLDVVHHHRRPSDDDVGIRIDHDDHNVHDTDRQLADVCDLARVEAQYAGYPSTDVLQWPVLKVEDGAAQSDS